MKAAFASPDAKIREGGSACAAIAEGSASPGPYVDHGQHH